MSKNVFHILKERGFIYQTTDDDALGKLLAKQKVTCYIGFDATADSLHIGSLVPIMALVVQRTGSIMHKRYLEVQQQFGRISTKAQENLAGIRIIKSYVLEDSEWKHFS